MKVPIFLEVLFMSWGACALIGAICTALSMVGWPYAMQFVPEITFVSTNIVAIVSGVLGILLMSFLGKRESGFAKFLFFVLCPLCFGIFYYYFGGSALFFGADWWKAALSGGASVLLFIVCMVILNAMDVVNHGFAFWIAGLFFLGVAIGLYFLIEMWAGKEVATLFTSTAMITYGFFNCVTAMFPEW